MLIQASLCTECGHINAGRTQLPSIPEGVLSFYTPAALSVLRAVDQEIAPYGSRENPIVTEREVRATLALRARRAFFLHATRSYKAMVSRGNPEQNKQYCTKPESRAAGHLPKELGTPTSQGERTDLATYTAAILAGANKRCLATTFPTQFLKYPRGTDSLLAATNKPRDNSVSNIVVVYVGGTGTGKTWRAHTELKARFGVDGYYVHEGGSKWWDGLEKHKGVLLDDYSGEWPITYLLKVLHEHPQKVEVKCGMVELQAKYFVITSNLEPDSWYPNADLPHKEALKRRITRVVWMNTPYQQVKEEPDLQENSICILDDE